MAASSTGQLLNLCNVQELRLSSILLRVTQTVMLIDHLEIHNSWLPSSLTFRGEGSTPDCRIRLLLNLQGQSRSTD